MEQRSFCLGDWETFLDYPQAINPWFPESLTPAIDAIAMVVEIVYALCLIIGFKTQLGAKLSGVLLLIFALSMTFSTSIKGALDFSVFSASADAFALSLMKEGYLSRDQLILKQE